MKKGKKSIGKIIAIVAIPVVAVIFMYWALGAKVVESDNAQLDGNIYSVRTSVAGYVKSICFADNQQVKKGELLAVLDTTDLKLKVIQAQSAFCIAKAKLSAAGQKAYASNENTTASFLTMASYGQNIVSAKANLTKAQLAFNRIQGLMKVKAATEEQMENAQSALEVAKAEYAKADNIQKSSTSSSISLKAMAKSEKSSITQAQLQVEQSKADLELAQHQLDYAVIKAPCDGYVCKRAIQLGQYLSVGQNICAVIDCKNLWITANFKETQLKNLQAGERVSIKIDAYPDLKLEGRVESFSGATGAKFALLPPDNATGNFIKITQRVPVKISIKNLPRDNVQLLTPGMSSTVKVYIK